MTETPTEVATDAPTEEPPTVQPTDEPVSNLPDTGEGAGTDESSSRGILLMLGGISLLMAAAWFWTREQAPRED